MESSVEVGDGMGGGGSLKQLLHTSFANTRAHAHTHREGLGFVEPRYLLRLLLPWRTLHNGMKQLGSVHVGSWETFLSVGARYEHNGDSWPTAGLFDRFPESVLRRCRDIPLQCEADPSAGQQTGQR